MKPIVLLVDDNKDIIDFLVADLSGHYEIKIAFNGKAALNMLEAEAVDLIISDVMMPVMDGFELCRQVKSGFMLSHIPVILLTAKDTLQSKIQGLEHGADAYIEKPFSPEYLHVQIRNLLSNRSKVRDYFATSHLAHIKSIAFTRADEQFLEKMNSIILEKMHHEHFDVDDLARELNMSRPTLYRKVKEISSLTPNELINVTRLKRAATLLAEGSYKVYEVADMVGYSSQTYFGKSFQKQFGLSPTEFIHSLDKGKETKE
jgi:DNA-binding response OmpR family regulator